MTDLNNSGMSDLEDVNEVLKDEDTTTAEKETELGKIKQKFGRGGFIKIDKFIEVKTKIVNFTIDTTYLKELKDTVVTQGTATGTLMVALNGYVTTIKVKQNDDSPTEFNDTVDLVINSIQTISITSAEYLKVYYGICRKKLKQSRYKNFKKKNENTSAEFDNAFIDRVLDYDDLTPEDDSEGPLDSKEKLQKMVDLTNSKTTTTNDEKKFAGKDKDIHITVDGKGSESSTSTKSYKIGNFSGWNKSGNTVSYDSNKVGAGNRPSSMTDTDWEKSKKEKTMYWKKDTTGQQGGVYRKKKKKASSSDTVTQDWNGNGRHKKKTVENIDETELNDVKENVDADSPIIEVGETNDATDGDAYVLFKLKRKPKNATKVE